MKILELIIDELSDLTGIDAVALVEEPAIEADFYAFNNQAISDYIIQQLITHELFVDRLPGESRESYMDRCIPKLRDEGYDEDQAAAICYDGLSRYKSEFASILQDGKPLFDTKEEAERVAKELGCEGSHEHEIDGKVWYMPCNEHSDLTDDLLEKYEFESYTDYPESATNAAKRALKWKEEHPENDCGTRVGWARANQLAKREPISEETIARMASFARHLQHEDVPYSEGCGGLMVDAWGGRAGIEWAKGKLERIREEQSKQDVFKKALKFESQNIKYKFAFDDDKQMVVGPLMIPDKLIFRMDENGDPYYVFFSKETIQQLSQKMMRDKVIDKMNLEHDPEHPVDAYMVSSWIVEDMDKDKQQVYGFNYPEGTWFGQYKIEDKEVWEKVKNGEIKGFSIEGFFADKFIQNNRTNI